MKPIYTLILAILLLSSCSRWCAKHSQVSTKDSLIYIEKIKLDTVKLVIPSDTTWLVLPFNFANNDTIKSENAKQSIQIVYKDRYLKIRNICKEDSLKQIITTLQSEKKTVKETTIKVPVKFTPWWVKVKLWGAFLIIVALFVYVVYLKLFK